VKIDSGLIRYLELQGGSPPPESIKDRSSILGEQV
jgi:hypothetical protein